MTDSSSHPDHELTLLLRAAAGGDRDAVEEFTGLVYGELERVARGKLYRHYGRKAQALTLEPAALVNESLMRLLRADPDFENRAHFFAFVSRVMTRVMLDYQKRRGAEKRGAGQVHVTLSGVGEELGIVPLDPLQEALDELEALDERKACVVRLRALWGLQVDEVAEILGMSQRTVERDWRFARSWLAARLGVTSAD